MTTPIPSRREERRRDQVNAAQIRRDDEVASVKLRAAEAKARAERKAVARARRAVALGSALHWLGGHAKDLLLVPVIAVPAVLAWTAMAQAGEHWFGPRYGWLLPALTEGAPWALAAQVAMLRRTRPETPVRRWVIAIIVAASVGAAVNFLHGLPGGVAKGIVMAIVSVAGIGVHQLVTAPAARSRYERAVQRREDDARRLALTEARILLGADGSAELSAARASVTLERRWFRTRLASVRLLAEPLPRAADETDTPAPILAPPGPDTTTDSRPIETADSQESPGTVILAADATDSEADNGGDNPADIKARRNPPRPARTPRPKGQQRPDKVAALLSRNPGLSNAEIAKRAGVAVRTVERRRAQQRKVVSIDGRRRA